MENILIPLLMLINYKGSNMKELLLDPRIIMIILAIIAFTYSIITSLFF